ncbi:MAG: pyridoxal phosphate-dependent aminotransferase [Candidatus Schekmanbacteria bacterium]|nr:MAG: pyridoxal phosphate-dependent aminotransferase [Candidatus Schekmanbacteria bacterium]
MKIAERIESITPFIVMDVLDRAKQLEKEGREIVHLEVGEPDFDTPSIIMETGIDSIRRGDTHYTHSLGLIELREAISEHYQRKYNVEISPDQIIVTSGTSPAMLLIFGALLNPGDNVLMSNPYYPCYPNFVKFVGGNPLFFPIYEENGFRPDIADMKKRIDSQTKSIIVNSPANPTGIVLDFDTLSSIASLGPYVISDEIYHGLVYEGKEHSILEITDNAFVLNGFSKLYAMTGWRLGYVIAPKKFIRPMQKLQQNLFISASAFAQRAAIAALREADEEIKKMVRVFNMRRIFIIDALKKLGFGIKNEPTGAFYVFANAKKFASNSYDFAFKLLEKAGVAVTPGIDFGTNGEGYIRFSYSNSIQNIEKGIKRIEEFLKNFHK